MSELNRKARGEIDALLAGADIDWQAEVSRLVTEVENLRKSQDSLLSQWQRTNKTIANLEAAVSANRQAALELTRRVERLEKTVNRPPLGFRVLGFGRSK